VAHDAKAACVEPMNEPNEKSNLIQELVRRRIFRSAGAYLVIAWVAIQVGSIVFPEFGAPNWALRALIILFIIGFPPAMLLAWTVDFSVRGLHRTTDSGYSRARGIWPKLAMLLVTAAMSAGALWWVWDDYIIQRTERPSRTTKTQPVIAVNALRQLTGDSANNWLGNGVANLLRSELSESSFVILISQAQWAALTADAGDQVDLVDVALRMGVDYLIDGEYFETSEGIAMTLHLDDLEAGTEIHSTRVTGSSAAEIIARVPELSTGIKSALRIPHQESVGLFEADFASEHIEAYEAYIAGLADYIAFDYHAAEMAFLAALEIAPDYQIARFRLAQVYESTGRSELAWNTLNTIPTEAPLSDRLRMYIDGAKVYFTWRRDAQQAIEIYRKLVDAYPYETEAGQLLAEAYWLNYQDESAIAEFYRLARIHPYDPTSWMALGERLLDVGKLDEAKDALSRYASMKPEDPFAFALLGNLALLQGDLDSSVANHERALEIRPGFVVARIGLARSRYLQGGTRDAETIWRSIVDDGEVAAAFRIDTAFELAAALRGQGRFRAALAPLSDTLELIREEALRLPMALSQLGSTHMELGETDRAQALLDEAISLSADPATRYLFARGQLELRLHRYDGLNATVVSIRKQQRGTDDTDFSEAKAASYLEGMAALQRGDTQAAAAALQEAVDKPGYQYAVYRIGLAELQRATGDLAQAAELAAAAAGERDAGDLRLDLELDRARAQLLHAEILWDLGDVAAARERAQAFLDRWQGAAGDQPELNRARTILELR
jgi:tetratricopeptide (TPR) repeat protein